jgi:hypothetical protein
VPLLAEVRRRDDEDPPAALRPTLGDDEAGLDRLPEADFVREKGPVAQGRANGKESCVDLVWVQVDACACDGAAQSPAVFCAPAP